MKTEEIVKQELRELKYYYSRRSNMEELFKATGKSGIMLLAEKYNNYIRTASVKLYDLYGCIYIQNKTQEGVAIELGYAQDTVRKIHRELVNYFCKCIEKDKEEAGYGRD